MPDSITTDQEANYHAARQLVDAALASSRDVSTDVTDEASAKAVVEVLGQIVGARKGAEQARKALTQPLNEQKKTIDNRFKEMTGPLDGAEQALKDVVADYRSKVEQERRERIAKEERNRRERQAREDAKAAEEKREPIRHAAPRIEAEPEATMRSGGTAATVRKVWKFEVLDETAVPRHYCKPDEAAIKAAMRDGVREIPGVRIYEDDQVAVS